MSEPSVPRPRQVTLAAAVLIFGSVLLVVLAYDRIAALHTLDTRESIDRQLADLPTWVGLDTGGVLTLIRTFGMIAAACATAIAILGYQVLQRSRSARVVISVLAVPLFVTGMVTGGFVSSVVAASAVILWLQPARSWFDGVPPPERPSAAARRPVPPAPERGQLPSGVWPAPYAAQADARPATVLWACVLTWVGSGLAILGLAAAAVALAVDPHLVLDEAHRQNPDLAEQGVTDGMLVAVTLGLLLVLAAWCVFAIVVAVLVFRRVAWARIVLIVSASVSAVVCLAGSAMGALLLLLPLMASVVAVALLARPDTGPWFDRRPPHEPPYQSPRQP